MFCGVEKMCLREKDEDVGQLQNVMKRELVRRGFYREG